MNNQNFQSRKIIRCLILTMLFVALVFAGETEKTQVFKLTGQEMTETPISPLLYSNFIELGYGIQAEAMWSEMLFNRSFERVPHYTGINKECFDLFLDGGTPGKIYGRDWSAFDWYHTGYEHNAWFAAPGTANPASWIDDSSTFFICETSLADCEIRQEAGGSGHGEQCLRVINRDESQWAGVAQTGKLLKKGETYNLRGKIKSSVTLKKAELRFYKSGEWSKPIASFPLKNIGDQFSGFEIDFKNSRFEGWATFCLMIPPGSEIVLDDFSLKPQSAINGWRSEAIDVTGRVNPGLIRFPGGCFASFYDWRNGVGPYSERKPKESYFWGGLNNNDIGTAEFAMLSQVVGSEMMLCVNLYHPWKKSYEHYQGVLRGSDFPQFTSLSEGAQAAADWVAYCNLPAGSCPMADLRVKHGYKEPFNVRYWELDNEASRWFEAKDYAWAAVVYSRAMKAVDPSIKIGMISYGGGWRTRAYREQLEDMLEIAGQDIDFVADRNNAEGGLDAMLERLRSFNRDNGTEIKYCNTEWLPLDFDENIEVYNNPETGDKPSRSYMFSKWHYGMNVLKNLLAFQRRGGEVLFVNFNNLANTHSQSAIETPKEGVYLTASGLALELLSRSPAAWILEIEGYSPQVADEFQVQAAWDGKRQKLVLYVCNRTFEKWTTTFDLSALSKGFTKAEIITLAGEGPLAMNTLKNPNAIKRSLKNVEKLKTGDHYTVVADSYTFIQIVLEE